MSQHYLVTSDLIERKVVMRRSEIILSVYRIEKAIALSNVARVIIGASSKLNTHLEILEAFRSWSVVAANFTEIDHQVLVIFNLDALNSPTFWQTITEKTTADRGEVNIPVRKGLRYFLDFVKPLVNLLKQDNIDYNENDTHEYIIDNKDKGTLLLSVILPEEKSALSSPDRLVKVLNSVSSLYNAIAVMEGENDNDLSVAAIDSGSDKSFDFFGAAKLMESLKELIISLWDRIVFYRERKLAEHYELITKSLPILEKISAMKDAGTMSPEQAELLKRNIEAAAVNFISAGAIIPEMNMHAMHEPRQLMSPEPKLLSSSKQNLEPHDSSAAKQAAAPKRENKAPAKSRRKKIPKRKPEE